MLTFCWFSCTLFFIRLKLARNSVAASSGLSSPAENKFFSVNTSIFAAAALQEGVVLMWRGRCAIGCGQSSCDVMTPVPEVLSCTGGKSGHGLAMQNSLLRATATLLRFVSSAIGWTSRNTTHGLASTTENNGWRGEERRNSQARQWQDTFNWLMYCSQRMQLLPGNVPFDQLQFPSLPIYKDVFFFNLTNPDGFQKGEKPRVNEIGPYSYKWALATASHTSARAHDVLFSSEFRVKHFNESDLLCNQTLLQYTQTKTFHFNQERSGEGLHEDDIICTINLPLVVSSTNTVLVEMMWMI